MTSSTASTTSQKSSSGTFAVIWIQWQGRKYGPYASAADARREGFIIDVAPIDELPLGGWPIRWAPVPTLPGIA
jgi:hypothetical protein